MGTIFGKTHYPDSERETEQKFPIRYFDQVHPGISIEDTKFAFANPKKFKQKFHYPAKEPAKDY